DAGAVWEPPRTERVERDPAECNREQDLLPALDRGEPAAANADRVQRRKDGVVQREADRERVERPQRTPPDEGRRGRDHAGVDGERNRVGHTERAYSRPRPGRRCRVRAAATLRRAWRSQCSSWWATCS